MMMEFWMTAALFCLASQAAAAQEPKPCLSPSQYMGSLTYIMKLGELQLPLYKCDYNYDAIKERLQMKMFRGDEFLHEDLFLFHERVHYSWRGDRCSKEAIESHFEFMRVPENATFLSQVVLGTSSIAGHGLVVNNWRDSTDTLLSFTDADCLPISLDMEDPDLGVSASARFFNNLLESHPEVFVVPDICKHKRKTLKSQKRATADQKETEVAISYFLSFFQKQG
ncbi:uncharacterized protein LOC134456292 [Engraulis encrasicolus]|uniref:uncharacterized protein LOC134456292 n=1 Tax=Engraulis encrasicolus TaxID=184585 RepID=UPI002FD31BD7